MKFGSSLRKIIDTGNIVLNPLETKVVLLSFPRLYFADKDATGINFDSVRVIKDYNEIVDTNSGQENKESKNKANTLAEYKIRIEIEK